MSKHSSTFNIFFLLLLLCVTVYSQTTVETRNRGNIQRNTLDILSNDGTEIEIMATRGPGPGEGRRLKSTFSSRGFPSFRVARWSSDGEPDEQTGVSTRVGLLGLIEYRESANGTWGFDPTDTVVGTFSFVNMSFDPFVLVEDAQDDISYKYLVLDSTEKSTVSLPNIFDNFALLDPELSEMPLVRIGAGISDLRGFVGKLNRTLSPSTWQFGIEVFGYPYKQNDTFIAVKFLVESQETAYIRYGLSYIERDDPFREMNDLQADSPSYVSGIAAKDIAYFSWEVTAVTTGGNPYNLSGDWVQSGILASEIYLGNSDIIPFDDDFLPTPESVLDSVEYGRNVNETARSFLYFSLPVNNATSMNWDPYVGIDEADDPTEKSGAIMRAVSFILLVLCIIMLKL